MGSPPQLTLLHLARRFVGGLRPGGPPPEDERWVASVLGAGELGLWRRMSGPDRRHAVAVARRVVAMLGERADAPALAAALLHDVGKVESGLGTWGRVPATLAGLVARRRVPPGSRWGRYLAHDRIGAELLEAAGAAPLAIAWAREHHLPPGRWTVPQEVGAALKAADDD